MASGSYCGLLFFFFSSRRRHTRYWRDWSSDVCSSDLFWILLISPLGLLEPLFAYRIFALITLFITVGYLVWMAYEVRLRFPWAVVGTVMLLFSSPLLATLALGQIYPILALGLRSEEHTSELQSRQYLVCSLLLEQRKQPHRLRQDGDDNGTDDHRMQNHKQR